MEMSPCIGKAGAQYQNAHSFLLDGGTLGCTDCRRNTHLEDGQRCLQLIDLSWKATMAPVQSLLQTALFEIHMASNIAKHKQSDALCNSREEEIWREALASTEHQVLSRSLHELPDY
eukprot:1155803-Pelagomonas_calceolata.AAC.9